MRINDPLFLLVPLSITLRFPAFSATFCTNRIDRRGHETMPENGRIGTFTFESSVIIKLV